MPMVIAGSPGDILLTPVYVYEAPLASRGHVLNKALPAMGVAVFRLPTFATHWVPKQRTPLTAHSLRYCHTGSPVGTFLPKYLYHRCGLTALLSGVEYLPGSMVS